MSSHLAEAFLSQKNIALRHLANSAFVTNIKYNKLWVFHDNEIAQFQKTLNESIKYQAAEAPYVALLTALAPSLKKDFNLYFQSLLSRDKLGAVLYGPPALITFALGIDRRILLTNDCGLLVVSQINRHPANNSKKNQATCNSAAYAREIALRIRNHEI